jgi:hypothetical protein
MFTGPVLAAQNQVSGIAHPSLITWCFSLITFV